MLALFPDFSLCPDKAKGNGGVGGVRLKIACPRGQLKTASLYPSANLKTICVQQQVMSLYFSTLCFFFALYVQHA